MCVRVCVSPKPCYGEVWGKKIGMKIHGQSLAYGLERTEMVNDRRNDIAQKGDPTIIAKKPEVELKIYVLLKGGRDIMKDNIK